MKINLTKKQYQALAKTVYLGNWMANAQRTGSADDPHMKEYEEITDYVFSLASEFGFSETFEYDLEFGDYGEITEASRLHEEYNKQNLWEELPAILGERDFFKKYSCTDIKKMTNEECFTKRMECELFWEEEFEKHGLDRLRVEDVKKRLRRFLGTVDHDIAKTEGDIDNIRPNI